MDKMIMDKMTIDLNVFSLFMEDIIVSNMKAIVKFGLMLKAIVKFLFTRILLSNYHTKSSFQERVVLLSQNSQNPSHF